MNGMCSRQKHSKWFLLFGWIAVSFFFVIFQGELCMAADQYYKNNSGVYVLKYNGVEYALAYYGVDTSDLGLKQVSQDLSENIADICFDLGVSAEIPAIDSYKMLARLATIDNKCEWGFSINPDAFGFWRKCRWATYANRALSIIRGPNNINNDVVLRNIIGYGIVDRKLAVVDNGLLFRFAGGKKLSNDDRKYIVDVFNNIEKSVEANSEYFIGFPKVIGSSNVHGGFRYELNRKLR